MPPGSVCVVLLDWRLEPHLDEAQDVAIHNTSGHRLEEVRVRNRIEVARQIGVYDIGVAPDDMPVHFLDCVDSPTSGAIAVRSVLEVGLEDRLQHDLGGGLDGPVTDGRNTERALASAIALRDHHPPYRIGPIRLRDQVLAQARQPCLQARRINLGEAHSIHTRSARIGAGQPIGVA